jgi:CotH kinase protein/Lectin C-type domain/Putative metal-binding motif
MARHVYWICFVALILGIASCSADGGGVDPGEGPTAGTGGASKTGGGMASTPPPDATLFFAGDTIPEIRLTLSPAAVNGLNADPKTYVAGDVEVRFKDYDVALGSVGIRLKGTNGSLRSLSQKAAFLLNFDKFTKKQRLFGVEKLALNNMVQDASMMRERLGYRLFREGGVPAPRAAYATVWVNNKLYGLYATVEATDNSGYLKAWFGNDEGSLYEGAYGSDLQDDAIGTFDQDNGADVGFADLQALAAALDLMNDPGTFVADVSKVIDLDEYLAFAATEIFTGQGDGYTTKRNNFFVYRGPDGRWSFMPWGMDQSFIVDIPPWFSDGRVQQMCDASLECRLKLKKAFEDVILRAGSLDLISEATSLKAFLWDAAAADPRKEVDMAKVAATMDATIDYLKTRPAGIADRLNCADPSSVDNDMDGYAGCGQDCDDSDPLTYPGAPEVCDLADNDCDGVWDDDPMCPPCIHVPAMGGGTLAYCILPKTQEKAELDCVAQGGHLASIHNDAQQSEIATRALQIVGDPWYIGLNDLASEGKYVWTDGTPYDYSAWGPGEPNDDGLKEDCSQLASSAGMQWNDNWCGSDFRYICRLP